MKLAIIGCRWYNNWEEFCRILEDYKGSIEVIISGGSTGADNLASRWAIENSIPILVYPANWNLYGKSAGPIRNKRIIEESDQVLAFWDGISRGTGNSISLATKKGIPIDIIPIKKEDSVQNPPHS